MILDHDQAEGPTAADAAWWAGQTEGFHEDHPSYDLDCNTVSAAEWRAQRLADYAADLDRKEWVRAALAGLVALD